MSPRYEPAYSPFEDKPAEVDEFLAPAPPNPDASDPDEQQRLVDMRRRQGLEAREFWQLVFSTPVGRREMYALLEACHWSGQTHMAGPNGTPDPAASQYRTGQRDLGINLFLNWLRLNREGVMLMLDENEAAFIKAKADG